MRIKHLAVNQCRGIYGAAQIVDKRCRAIQDASSVHPLGAMIGGYGRETELSARRGAVGDLRLDFRIAGLVLRAIP
jgi:hypothetical protein